MADRLRAYRSRRDAQRSPEPIGDEPGGADGQRFVIQHHRASSEHYDFRLEHAGVLLSWAVPKGPSTDPREKRLAIRTEDHPLDYADFEGVIPPGEYGAGAVIVWDAGVWENETSGDDGDTAPVEDALRDGHLRFRIDGHKLSGGFVLQRIDEEADQWLLIKQSDDGADARRNPTSTEPASVISDLTVEEVAEADTDDTDEPPTDR